MNHLSPTAERNVDMRSSQTGKKRKGRGKRVGFVGIEGPGPELVSQNAKGQEKQQEYQSNPAPAAVPNYKSTVVLKVKMYCSGCAKEVTRSLSRVNGVTDVHVDLKNERVTVMGADIDPRKLCESLRKKTGKKCEVLQAQMMKEQTTKQSDQEVKSIEQSQAVETRTNEVKVIDQLKQPLEDYEKMMEMNELQNQIMKYLQYVAYCRRTAVQQQQVEYEELLDGEQEAMESRAIFSDDNPNACCIQ